MDIGEIKPLHRSLFKNGFALCNKQITFADLVFNICGMHIPQQPLILKCT